MPTPRSGYVEAPKLPRGTISVQPPPDVVEAQGAGNIIAMAVPMLGSMGIMVFMAMSNTSNPRMILMAGVMVVAMVSMVAFTTWRQVSQYRNKVTTQRREYLAYLSELREDVRRGAADQRAFSMWNLPEPSALPMIVQQRERLWERTDRDPVTFTARVGTNSQPLLLDLQEPELSPLSNADPVCLSAVSRFVKTFDTVDALPTGVVISDYSRIEITGYRESGRGLARAMCSSLTTLVGPELLLIAVIADEDSLIEWDWAKWLPHVRSMESDAVGQMRMIGSSFSEVLDLLPEEILQRPTFRPRSSASPLPQLMVIVDGVELSQEERAQLDREGVCTLELLEEWDKIEDYGTLRLQLQPRSDGSNELTLVTLADGSMAMTADTMSIPLSLAAARKMSRYAEKPAEEGTERKRGLASDPTRQSDLLDLLGLPDIRDFEPARDIVRREGRDRLNIPFGVTPEGIPVRLDIKENAQQGMGPHGLLIGATGSGKSEVLRTIVLALVLTHSPEQLNLVLVDFKGGATFAGMANLPHVSATITNLESELSLVDRMEEALHGEMVRRQELLRAAGNYANVRDYEKARLAGQHQHPPMPALFIILDEFSELLSAKPGFIDTFVAIGRLGRSLEIHLLLSTQKLEESKLRGLESHLSYRVGLRTFSAQDSRAVIGTPDAFNLPAVPGVGFLKTAGEGMTQFRASYVAAPPKPRKAKPQQQPKKKNEVAARILPFTAAPVLSREPVQETPEVEEDVTVELAGDAQWSGMALMDIAIKKIEPMQPRAHQVWLPPLDASDTLDMLFGDLTISPELGLHSPSWRQKGGLVVPIGIKDVPREQRREKLVLDLNGGAGHVSIYGGTQSGKSTALRTLIMALSLVNTPREAQFYILDMGGGTFAGFREGLHIAGIGTRDRPDVVNRILAEVAAIMADRELYFAKHGIDSMVTYRRGRAEGKYDDGYGDVFLVVDGWSNMKADFQDMDRTIQDLAGRALALGVHVFVATPRQADVRHAMQSIFGTVVELRLGEPRDSIHSTKIAQGVPEGVPGRGLSASEHHMLIGLPRIDGDSNPDNLADGVADAWQRMGAAWQGQPGPKLRMLPTMLELERLQKALPDSPATLLGVDEARLEPVEFDFNEHNHLYIIGDTEKGKSNALRLIARDVMRAKEPQFAQLFLIDFRRSLLQEVPDVYLAGYYASHDIATKAMKQVAKLLRERLPGPDITPQELRDRSWWKGPEFYILVDDYDMVNNSMGNPLQPLIELMPQARDIGMHLVVTRRTGGASRGMYDPLMRAMTDNNAPGMLLPGSPEEGPLIGKVKAKPGPAGRAQLVTRSKGYQLIQMAYAKPSVE